MPSNNSSCDRYELKCPLGKGKYSVVFKAMDSKRDEHVVVKILKPVRKPKINREIRILQAVKGGFYYNLRVFERPF